MSLKRKSDSTAEEPQAKRPHVVQVLARPPVTSTAPAVASAVPAPSASPAPASDAAAYPVGYVPRASTAARGAPILPTNPASAASSASSTSYASSTSSASSLLSSGGGAATSGDGGFRGVSVLQSVATRSRAATVPDAAAAAGSGDRAYVRSAGGQQWVDPTLASWRDDDYRIFVGDLGNECTDDMLKAAFSKVCPPSSCLSLSLSDCCAICFYSIQRSCVRALFVTKRRSRPRATALCRSPMHRISCAQ
jgi:hypothetical protein